MANATVLPGKLAEPMPEDRARLVRALWPRVKNGSQIVLSGHLAEAWFFSKLKDLETQGICTIRGKLAIWGRRTLH